MRPGFCPCCRKHSTNPVQQHRSKGIVQHLQLSETNKSGIFRKTSSVVNEIVEASAGDLGGGVCCFLQQVNEVNRQG